jgi:hypothetical protein
MYLASNRWAPITSKFHILLILDGRDVVENVHFMKGYLCRWGLS